MFFDILMFQKSEIQKSTNYGMESTLRAFERAITLTQAISQSAYQFGQSYGLAHESKYFKRLRRATIAPNPLK